MSYGGSRKWIKKPSKKAVEEEDKTREAEPEAPSGPSYGQAAMLRLYDEFKKKGIPDEFKLGYATEGRPVEAATDDTTSAAAREALREVLKSQREDRKQAKRQASGSFSGASPTAAAAAITPKAGTPIAFPGMPMFPPLGMPQGVPPMQYWCPLWGSEATMRLSNVPCGYKQETLAALLGVRFRGAIDFLFLPPAKDSTAESVNNCTYAWVNFRSQQAVHDFKTAFNNVRAGTAFPGSEPAAGAEAAEGGDKNCKVQKAKIQQLDKLIAEVRQQASTGKSVRMPILWDLYGRVQPIPTADAHSAAAAVAAQQSAAAMSAAAYSGNTYAAQIKQQIEYYFSFDNMCRDVFLRGNMDEEGWVPMSLIAGFNKIKQFGVSPETLGTFLTGSEVVEVDSDKKRLRQLDAKQRMIWELKGNLDGQDASKDAKVEDAKA